jgi:hypothetical protein
MNTTYIMGGSAFASPKEQHHRGEDEEEVHDVCNRSEADHCRWFVSEPCLSMMDDRLGHFIAGWHTRRNLYCAVGCSRAGMFHSREALAMSLSKV